MHGVWMGVPDKILAMIADEVFRMMAGPGEVQPFTDRFATFGLEDAYQIVNEISRRREAQGGWVVGRKIGFTNAAAWSGYGISGPIWNYLYDTTTLPPSGGTFPLATWPNVRMETEIALGLSKAPEPGIRDDDLLPRIDWAALDFIDLPQLAIQGGRCGGDRRACRIAAWRGALHRRGLQNAGGVSSYAFLPRWLRPAAGGGAQVPGSPLKALGYVVRELARFGGKPFRAGEFVTTGTLTQALLADNLWRAEVKGIDLAQIEVRLVWPD
jgi:2-keto-4-pentenoate hydratase